MLFAATVVTVYLFVHSSSCKLNRDDAVSGSPVRERSADEQTVSEFNLPMHHDDLKNSGGGNAACFVCRDSTDAAEELNMMNWLCLERQEAHRGAKANAKKTTNRDGEVVRKDSGTSVVHTDPIKRGLELMLGSDCGICHTQTVKLIGPPYTEIAKRYSGDGAGVARLANKIIEGGSGSWGTVPMTPHSDLTPVDARLIVQYILTLND
jgi:cytochrome c